MARSLSISATIVVFGALVSDAARPSVEEAESAVIEAAIKNKYDNETASAFIALHKEREWGCHEYCFTCPGEVSWRLERSQSGVTTFAKGALAVGGLAALAATGVLAIPVAGIVATIGVSAGAAMGAGAIGGGILVRDLLAGERYCPNVKFHERNPQNTGFGFKKAVKEEEYRLDEINFLELLAKTRDTNTGTSLLGKTYKRNEMSEQDRLNSLIACNYLMHKHEQWADLAIQSEHMTAAVRRLGDTKKAVVAECAKWLCAGSEPTEVKELGSYTASVNKCGGRSSWHPKSWA